jgi:hypothetical protein
MGDPRPHSDPGLRRPYRPFRVREVPERVLLWIKTDAWWVFTLLALFAAVVALLVSIPYLRHDPVTADPGDCLNETKHVVSCTSPKALYRVVGEYGIDRNDDCPPHELTYSERGGRGVTTGYVLCLDFIDRTGQPG